MAKSTSIFVLLLCYLVSADEGPTIIKDIRASFVDGYIARFLANREDCLEILETRTSGLGLRLASDVQDRQYDTSQYSELLISIEGVGDRTLRGELDGAAAPPPVSAGGMALIISLPVVSCEKHVLLQLAAYTDEKNPMMVPYNTNYRAMTSVDYIAFEQQGFWSTGHVIVVQNGADEIKLFLSKVCLDDYAAVGQDIGADILSTNYPMPFDWGCDEYSFGFCEKINAESGEPTRAFIDGNVCTTMTSSNSRGCTTTAALNAITGGFLDSGFPVPTGALPVQSIEAKRLTVEHSTGIVFPCMG